MSKAKANVFTVEIDNKNVDLYFKRPSQVELFEIDLTYRKIYSEALRHGVMTESEAKKLFKSSNAWTKEDEDKISDMSLRIANAQRVLEATKHQEKSGVLSLITQITEMRNELVNHITQRTTMFSNTAEGIANEQRMHKVVELCLCQKEDNDHYFETTESYKKFVETHPDELSEIYKQAWLFEYSIPENTSESYPEIQVLRELTEKEIAEAQAEEAAKQTPIEEVAS